MIQFQSSCSWQLHPRDKERKVEKIYEVLTIAMLFLLTKDNGKREREKKEKERKELKEDILKMLDSVANGIH